MYRKYLFPILLLVAVLIGAANAVVVNEQITGPERTWLNGGVRLGMPGLANILKHSDDPKFEHFEGILPFGDNKLVIPLKHVVSYGGKDYRHLTVASGGRIFLGDYGKYVLPEDGFDGSYPYVKAVNNEFIPAVNFSNIPVRWRMFSDHGDVFTVVEFGPFNVVGHSDNLLCQVSFYDDGEIQVQHWNLDRSIYHVINVGTYGSLVEGSYMQSPYVYNGGKRVSLSGDDFSKVYSTRLINIFEYGKFREGWIAKPFNSNDPMFKLTDEGDYRRTFIDVDFGLDSYSGGVIAYDHARENPVVGSFQRFDFWVTSSGGPEDEPVYLWYFNENTTKYASKTDEAGYPYIVNTNRILSDKARSSGASENCLSGGITPCAYLYSWVPLKNPTDVIDTVIAPAIKMQVVHLPENDESYKGRKLRIHYIRFRPMQPQSYQFRPAGVHEIKFESKSKDSNANNESVGYLEVAGSKAPLKMADGTNVEARIKLPPGYEVAQIEINGYLGYDDSYKNPFVAGVGMSLDVDPLTMGNHPYVPLRGFYIEKLATQNEMQVRFPLMSDVTISVTYRECSEKKLPTVVPSYVKNEVYLDPSNNTKTLETYSVKNGFGQVVQTQTALNNGLFSVSAEYLDDADNTLYAPKSYVVKKSTYSFENMFCYQCVLKSSAYYDGQTNVSKERVDSYGFPYTERNYHYGENTALVGHMAGIGQASFELGDNFVKTWKLPLKTCASTEFFDVEQLKADFKESPNGVGKVFDDYYSDRLNAITEDEFSVDGVASYPFELTVNQAMDGTFTQSISDAAGNLVATWITHEGDVLITRNVYDVETSLLMESFVEGRPSFKTTYTYDYAGRLIATESPDYGRSETKYDSKNRIRFTRDARQITNPKSNDDYFNIFIYDEQDRLVKMGEVRGKCNGCSFNSPDTEVPDGSIYLLSETIYGVPSVAMLTGKSNMLSNALATDIVNSIEGVGLNDVGAIIAYDGYGNVNTIKMASYDRLNRKKKQWIVNLVDNGTPTIETEYGYTIAGQIAKTVISKWEESQSKWVPISKRIMEYKVSDRFNHLEKVYEQSLTDDNVKKLLAFYKYNDVGTLEKTIYYDNGQEVMTKLVDGDIYGRTTNIVYKGANGDNLYSEKLEYKAPLINRLSSIKHSWADNTAQKKTANESFDYDDLGRLTTFTTDMGGMTGGQYTYDILGRLTAKSEAGSSITYGYVDGSYRPVSLSVNNVSVSRALEYDASGNLWLDGNNKVAYKINALGLPERVARFNDHFPNDLLYEDFVNGKKYEGEGGNGGPGGEWASMSFKYDDGGNRIFEKSATRGAFEYGRLTVPGVGMFEQERYTAYELKRLDLVGGGFRLGLNGEALFPLTDAQGNIRGYVSRSGWRGLHAYYPFGTTVDFLNQQSEDERRWQGKEFDGEHGKLYFGARYYDPFLGLWMSPDPAGQFANPYSYGGDPLNYIDPTGLWSFGLGLVFGWDSGHGWHVGLGASMDFSKEGSLPSFDFSYTWNQDGSNSFNIGGNMSIWIKIVDINFGLSYSYNTYSGSVLSTHGGVCFGKMGVACAGVDNGYAAYWDRSGNFMGATAYLEAYAEVAGGLARVSGGLEAGFFGMEGRGLYASGTVAGLHGEVSQRDGGSWGFEQKVYLGFGNNTGIAAADGKTTSLVSAELWLPSLGEFGHFTFGNGYDVSSEGIRKKELQEDISILEKSSNPEDVAVVERLRFLLENKDKKITTRDFLRIGRALRRNGFEPVERMGDHSDGASKFTFRKAGSREYGQHEFMSIVMEDKAYCSYNYGNNFLTHFLIDYLGWKGRGD